MLGHRLDRSVMDLDKYRTYINRPKPIMGFPIFYCVPNTARTELTDDILEDIVRQKHPNLSKIHMFRYADWTYIGVIEGSKDGEATQDTESVRRADG
jgi:hypothetical protein